MISSTLVMASYSLEYTGLDCPSAAGRSIPRLFRDQGRQNPAGRPSRSSHWYPNGFLPEFAGRLITFAGRIAGQDGKTKFTIENASRTRIVLADTYVQSSLLFNSPTFWNLTNSWLGKYISSVRSRTSRLPGTPSYLSSSGRRQARFMPVCVQSAAECVNEHCSRSEYRVYVPAKFAHHTPTSSPRTCVLFSCYRLQVHVMLLTVHQG